MKVKTKEYTLDIYSSGLVYCSVCTDAPEKEVAGLVNEHNPTGLDHGWHIADEPFKDGTPNPSPCEQGSGRKHYLLVC